MPQPFVITGNIEFQGDLPIISDLECDRSNRRINNDIAQIY